jgi:hypothetical protein
LQSIYYCTRYSRREISLPAHYLCGSQQPRSAFPNHSAVAYGSAKEITGLGIEKTPILGRSVYQYLAVDRHVQDQEIKPNWAPRAETLWTRNLGNCPCTLQRCVSNGEGKAAPFARALFAGHLRIKEWHEMKQEFRRCRAR